MKLTRSILLAAAWLARASAQAATESPDPLPNIAPENLGTLVALNNLFALESFHQFSPDSGSNAFFSPYSISTALAMTWAGARGETAAQLSRVLHFDALREADVPPAFGALQGALAKAQETTGAQLNVANSLWPESNPEEPFLPAYMNMVQAQFASSLFPVDFKHDAQGARLQINRWVEEKTQNKIKDLLQPIDVDSLTRLILVNAIYFRAAWALPFNVRATQESQFHPASGGATPVLMMSATQTAPYAEVTVDGQPVQILALNYANAAARGRGPGGGNGLSFIAILPREANGLPALEKALTAETLKNWLGQLADTRLQIFLPKFKLEERYQLPGALKAMGVKNAFIDPIRSATDPNRADFSGMNGHRTLYISNVIHQTFVAVDEAGTEAAAATAVIMARGGARAPAALPVFRADHPFLFLIREDSTGSILFLGRLAQPAAANADEIAAANAARTARGTRASGRRAAPPPTNNPAQP